MTTEIELSIMAANGQASRDAVIKPLLDRFEAETGIHVRLRMLTWDSAFNMFVRAALYDDSPDVSEVGTTWVGDMIGLNALHAFNVTELTALGRPSTFLPATWKSAAFHTAGLPNERVWSIPWLAGVRLIYYRPELLEKAGLDPETAFSSIPQFTETIRLLSERGVHIPWMVPTGNTHTTLHNIASWVWGTGGDFLASDGKETIFTQPAALAGMADYYGLGRYLAPEVRYLNGLEPDDFLLGTPNAAVTISGPWLFTQSSGGVGGRIEVALPPGPTFMGGSNLIIWKSSRNPEAAFKLVRFLTKTATEIEYAPSIGLLPARAGALDTPPFSTDPYWRTVVRGLNTGRTFPTIRLWGLLEDRLTAAFHAIWNDVLADPTADIQPILLRHLQPVASRLDEMLKKE